MAARIVRKARGRGSVVNVRYLKGLSVAGKPIWHPDPNEAALFLSVEAAVGWTGKVKMRTEGPNRAWRLHVEEVSLLGPHAASRIVPM